MSLRLYVIAICTSMYMQGHCTLSYLYNYMYFTTSQPTLGYTVVGIYIYIYIYIYI